MRRFRLNPARKRRQTQDQTNVNDNPSGCDLPPASALLFEAWARGDVTEGQLVALLDAVTRTTPSMVVNRVKIERLCAAVTGALDADLLADDEAGLFMALFAEYMSHSNAEGRALAARMTAEGDYIGEDDQGRLIRTLPGGRFEFVDDKAPALLSGEDTNAPPIS